MTKMLKVEEAPLDGDLLNKIVNKSTFIQMYGLLAVFFTIFFQEKYLSILETLIKIQYLLNSF
jgi:hypothetical protein